MSLQIVSGKPGSGKSYHTVVLLLAYLEDWARFELKEERAFDRVLYTNLTLDTDKINAYLSDKIGQEVDISHYIFSIDEDVRRQFAANEGKFPLAVLPQNAMIVIDEVQRMFGSEMDGDKKNKKFEIEFRNYISTHRHHGHDLIFITQHTDNISKSILSMAEKMYQIENAKHHGFPFPINISLADVDVVKEAFGIKGQFYRCSVGKYQGRRVKFDKEVTSHVMKQEVYACYSSHTMSDITSDRPSLNLTKWGAIWWFTKKHAWHLGLKVIVAGFLLFWGLHLIKQFPVIITSALSKSLMPANFVPSSTKTTNPSMLMRSPAPPVIPGIPPSQIVQPMPISHGCTDPNCTIDHSQPIPIPVMKPNEKITAIFPVGVITDNGRRKIGQPVSIDGEEEIIKTINVRQGSVLFESGKRVMVPK